ncbi:hypothetical protein AU476_09590 [Cupriavidus sp. UYMSc13B]|nr:hypothetical protein AU476_09590 [Cupriavidus sp. UYMSc13B]
MDIHNIQAVSAFRNFSEIEPDAFPVALDDILKSAFVDANHRASTDMAEIDARIADSATFTNPKQLFELQTNLANYNIYTSLVSTLTRKAVSAVETLIKAQ